MEHKLWSSERWWPGGFCHICSPAAARPPGQSHLQQGPPDLCGVCHTGGCSVPLSDYPDLPARGGGGGVLLQRLLQIRWGCVGMSSTMWWAHTPYSVFVQCVVCFRLYVSGLHVGVGKVAIVCMCIMCATEWSYCLICWPQKCCVLCSKAVLEICLVPRLKHACSYTTFVFMYVSCCGRSLHARKDVDRKLQNVAVLDSVEISQILCIHIISSSPPSYSLPYLPSPLPSPPPPPPTVTPACSHFFNFTFRSCMYITCQQKQMHPRGSSANVEDMEVEQMKTSLQFHFMNPFQKWRNAKRRRFPWKLFVQLLNIILVTLQVMH